MMHFKYKKKFVSMDYMRKSCIREGFTLIEALIAIMVLGIVMTPVFILQGTILRGVAGFSRRIQRIFRAKTFLLDARIEAEKQNAQQFTLEKKIIDPPTRLSYHVEPVSKKSSLSSVKHLYVERVTASWDEDGQKKEEVVVGVLFKEPKKKREES